MIVMLASIYPAKEEDKKVKLILDVMCAAGVLLCGIALVVLVAVVCWSIINDGRRR